jgi:hypothetical protein
MGSANSFANERYTAERPQINLGNGSSKRRFDFSDNTNHNNHHGSQPRESSSNQHDYQDDGYCSQAFAISERNNPKERDN